MSDLRDLYQELILDHNKRPRNFQKVEGANCKAEGYNPLCGDKVTIYLKIEEDIVSDIGFEGGGCAISTASASLMTESVKKKRVADARSLFQSFHRLTTGEENRAWGDQGEGVPLGKLVVFSGVSQYPARVKCATLAWHTLQAALDGKGDPVSTE